LITQEGADKIILAKIKESIAKGGDNADALLTAMENAGPTKDGTDPRRKVPAFRKKLAVLRQASNSAERLADTAQRKVDDDDMHDTIRDFIQGEEFNASGVTQVQRDSMWREFQMKNKLDGPNYRMARTMMQAMLGSGDPEGAESLISKIITGGPLSSEEFNKETEHMNETQRRQVTVYNEKQKELQQTGLGKQRAFKRRTTQGDYQESLKIIEAARGVLPTQFVEDSPDLAGFKKNVMRQELRRFELRIFNGADKIVIGEEKNGDPIYKGLEAVATESRDRINNRLMKNEDVNFNEDLQDFNFSSAADYNRAFQASKRDGISWWSTVYKAKQKRLAELHFKLITAKEAGGKKADSQRENSKQSFE
jgi:hypothetical protein